MTNASRLLILLVLGLAAFPDVEVTAQPLGSFRWRTEPYCNVITLAVSQNGAVYTLDGFDEPCGNNPRLPLHGIAVPQANGSVTFGLSVLNVPGGAPVNLEATINLPAVSGTWRDSAGNTGALTFSPSGAPGAPRPLSGPSNVYARFADNLSDLPNTYEEYGSFNYGKEVIVSLPLPVGLFHIQAKAFTKGAAGNVGCVLVAGPNVDAVLATVTAVQAFVPLSMQVLNQFASPGNAELRCTDYGEGVRGLYWIKVHATQVGSIQNFPVP